MAKTKDTNNTIIINRKARHEYFIEDRFEAGLVLQGWEVKSLRAHRVQLVDSHVILRKGEAWLLNCLITPLPTASTHFVQEPSRTRKILLHAKELAKLIGYLERKGYTLVPLLLYWKKGRCKVELGLARGKKEHDKREASKDRDWQRQKQRLMQNKG